MKCEICDHSLLSIEGTPYFVIINGETEMICQKCFEQKFSKFSNKRCEVCGKKDPQNYPYFFKKDKKLSLVCRECHDRVYGDDKK